MHVRVEVRRGDVVQTGTVMGSKKEPYIKWDNKGGFVALRLLRQDVALSPTNYIKELPQLG